MKVEAVVFDLDGTILDTLGDLSNSVNFALAKNNLPGRSQEEVRGFVGNGIRLLIERAVPEGTSTERIDACFDDFKAHYKENSAVLTKAYDGMTELLSELKAKGIKTAVVSNKADFAVQILVEKYFQGLFDYSVGEKDGIRRKPCPDSLLCAMDYLGVTKNNCVYVGDSDVDIQTARNSGVECICVTWGFRNEDFLKGFSPDYIVHTPEEILCITGE